MEGNPNTQSLLQDDYENNLKALNSRGEDIVISYIGVLSQEKVNSIAFDVESKLMQIGEKKGIIKRVFSIIIETLQNIRLHCEKDQDGLRKSFVIVSRNNEEYNIYTGNFLLDEIKDKISEKIKYINQLDRQGLKDYYMEVLTDGERSSKGGAGLGFITIAMKSKNKLNFKFEKADESLKLFSLNSKVT